MSEPNDVALGDGLNITLDETITEWRHGDILERIVVPSGQITDFSSIPDRGLLGWTARKLGFDKKAPHFKRSGKIHDILYFYLKTNQGVLPDGWFQFFNPETQQWQPIIGYQWNREQADSIWERISVEDGCDPKVAKRGRKLLNRFGGWHMLLKR